MIRLLKFSNTEYVVLNGEETREGNLNKAAGILLGIGVNEEEIEAALIDMRVKRNNTAEFGVNKTFIFSHRYEKAA